MTNVNPEYKVWANLVAERERKRADDWQQVALARSDIIARLTGELVVAESTIESLKHALRTLLNETPSRRKSGT